MKKLLTTAAAAVLLASSGCTTVMEDARADCEGAGWTISMAGYDKCIQTRAVSIAIARDAMAAAMLQQQMAQSYRAPTVYPTANVAPYTAWRGNTTGNTTRWRSTQGQSVRCSTFGKTTTCR